MVLPDGQFVAVKASITSWLGVRSTSATGAVSPSGTSSTVDSGQTPARPSPIASIAPVKPSGTETFTSPGSHTI